jgi:hypothetical protein
MYAWIWRKLPGGWPGKLLGSLALLAGVLALLFYVVFPFVQPRLPWNHVEVSHPAGMSGPAAGLLPVTRAP